MHLEGDKLAAVICFLILWLYVAVAAIIGILSR